MCSLMTVESEDAYICVLCRKILFRRHYSPSDVTGRFLSCLYSGEFCIFLRAWSIEIDTTIYIVRRR